MPIQKPRDGEDEFPAPQPIKVGLRPDPEISIATLAARVEQLSDAINVQFTRIAQMQAEIDLLRKRDK